MNEIPERGNGPTHDPTHERRDAMTYRERLVEIHRHFLALTEEATTPEWKEHWSRQADWIASTLLVLDGDTFLRPESIRPENV